MSSTQRKFLCTKCNQKKWKRDMANPTAKRPRVCVDCSKQPKNDRESSQGHPHRERPKPQNRTRSSEKRRFILWGVDEQYRRMLRRCAEKYGITMPVAAEMAFELMYKDLFTDEERRIHVANDRSLEAHSSESQRDDQEVEQNVDG